jgi:hypothetical protein
MPLTGRTTTDRVTLGTTPALDNLDPATFACWAWLEGTLNQTAVRLICKSGGGTIHGLFPQQATAFTLTAKRGRATTSTEVEADWANLALAQANKWLFLVGQTDTVTAGNNRIFCGDVSNPPLEASSYRLQTAGSGTVTSNAGLNAELMNADTASFGVVGMMAWGGVWNRLLTPAELVVEQQRSLMGLSIMTSGLRYMSRPGDDGGVVVLDRSPFAAHGKISGATPANPRWPFVSADQLQSEMRPPVRLVRRVDLTGTAVGGITEADLVAGGKTIIATVTADTWIAN